MEENEYGYNGSNLKPVWQWNHNPNNNLWSLTDREGYLRLKSGLISKNIRDARNTLTQRTFGPTSGAVTVLEVGHMREGDVAGLTAFQNQYGFVGIKIENGAVRAAGYPLIQKGMYLTKGAKVSLRTEVLPEHASQKTVVFSSSKKSVVSVSAKGMVKAVAPGKAKIIIAAKDGGAKAVLPVQVVKKKKVNHVLKAAKSTLKVRKGGKAELPIKKLTAKTTSPVTYKSLNKKIAVIDQYGIITGSRKGNTKIKVTCGKKTIMVRVKVV